MSFNYWNYGAQNPYQQAQELQSQYQVLQQRMAAQNSSNAASAPMPTVAYINGIEGAKAFVMPVNSRVYLLDADNPHIYLKTTDAQGKACIQGFLLTPLETPAAPDMAEFATKKDLAELRALIEQIKPDNITITTPKEEMVNG